MSDLFPDDPVDVETRRSAAVRGAIAAYDASQSTETPLFGDDAWTAPSRGASSAAFRLSEAASTVSYRAFEAVNEGVRLATGWDPDPDNVIRGAEERMSRSYRTYRHRVLPDPTRSSHAGQLLFGFSEIGALAAAGGPFGLARSTLTGAGMGIPTAHELIAEGVDEQTAWTAGGIEGAYMAAMVAAPVAIPSAARTLTTRVVQRAATGAGLNAGLGIAYRGSMGAYLRSQGYDEQADRYRWDDRQAAAADVLIGSVFGGAFGARGRPSRRGHSQEQIDAAMTVQDDRHARVGTAPGVPLNIDADARHARALSDVERQASEGEEFDAGDWSAADAENFAPRLDDVEAMALEIEYARDAAREEPQSLTNWVRRRGGISDDRGDIAGLDDTGIGGRAVLRRSGRSIDDLALAAWEEGFFPDLSERPTAREFIDALDQDARDPGSVTADEAALFHARNARDILRHYESRGIDPSLAPAELRQALAKSLAADMDGAIAKVLGEEGFAELSGEIAQLRDQVRGMAGEGGLTEPDMLFSFGPRRVNEPDNLLGDEAGTKAPFRANDYNTASVNRILDAASELAGANGGKLPRLYRDEIAARTGYAVSSVANMMHWARGGVFGPQIKERASALGYATVGAAPINRPLVASLMDQGLNPEQILPRLNAFRQQMTTMSQVRSARRAGDSLYSASPARTFYSAVERTVERSGTARASGAQWWATISKAPGVKKEELDWIGLEDFLKAQEGPISREDVLAFVRENGVRVEETVLGAPRELRPADVPSQEVRLAQIEERDRLRLEQQAPNGINAARLVEIDRRIDELDEQIVAWQDIMRGRDSNGTRWSQYTLPGGENYRELLLRLPGQEPFEAWLVTEKQRLRNEGASEEKIAAWERTQAQVDWRNDNHNQFRSSHFDQPNILAHVRFKERVDANGVRTLMIEEIQSDWHQSGRERGYETPERSQERAWAVDGANAELLPLRERDGQLYNEIVDLIKSPPYAQYLRDALTVSRPGAGDYYKAGMEMAGRTQIVNGRMPNGPLKEALAALMVARSENQTKILAIEARQRSAAIRNTVPDAPFKNNAWAALSMKRMIRWAAENGFEQIAWTRGKHQIERFSLGAQVDEIVYGRDGNTWRISGYRDGAARMHWRFEDSKLDEAVGADLSKRMREGAGAAVPRNRELPTTLPGQERQFSRQERKSHRMLSGIDLEIGGEGMRAFYDRILPNIANDLGKKFGARVGEAEIEVPRVGEDTPLEVRDADGNVVARYQGEDAAMEHAERIGGTYDFPRTPQTTVHSLPITPEMRDAAMQGVPLFSRGGSNGEGFSRPEQLQQIASEQFGADWEALSNAAYVKIVESSRDVPGEVPRGVKAVHLRSTGETYFIANNIHPREMRGLILHEIGVHHGMEDMLGKRGFSALLRQIDRMVDAEHPAAVEARYWAERFAARQDSIPEETLAYLVENNHDLPLTNSILAQVRQWLVKTFGTTFGLRLTVDDIRALAVSSLRRVAAQARREAGDIAIVELPAPYRAPPQVDDAGGGGVSQASTRPDGGAGGAGQRWTFDRYENWGDGEQIVARNERGKIVGFLRHDLNDAGEPYVADVMVDPSTRRQGIARALYAEAERQLGRPLVPSQIQTEDGLAFWRGTRPQQVEGRSAQLPSNNTRQTQREHWMAERRAFEAETPLPQPPSVGSDDALFSFGGPRSATHDPTAVQRAQEMEGVGFSDVAIWRETGWWRNPADGQWRYEIDDSKAKLREEAIQTADDGTAGFDGRLGVLMDFAELFEAYPTLADLEVTVYIKRGESVRGAHAPLTEDADAAWGIYLIAPSRKRALGALMHEIQHAIQGIEGFAQGGSAEAARLPEYAEAFQATKTRMWNEAEAGLKAEGLELDQVMLNNPEGYQRLAEWLDAQAAINVYLRMAGEMEARNVENRRGEGAEPDTNINRPLTLAERKTTPPTRTFDFPIAEAVVPIEDGAHGVAIKSVAGDALGARPSADGERRVGGKRGREESRGRDQSAASSRESIIRDIKQAEADRQAERTRADAFAKLDPAEQVIAENPSLKLRTAEGDVPARQAIEMSEAAQARAVEMKKGYDAAIKCAIRHGGSMAGRSFITMGGASARAGATAALGRGLGMAAAVPVTIAGAPVVARDAPRWRREMRQAQSFARANEMGLDPPTLLDKPEAGIPISEAADETAIDPAMLAPETDAELAGVAPGAVPGGGRAPPAPAGFADDSAARDEAIEMVRRMAEDADR